MHYYLIKIVPCFIFLLFVTTVTAQRSFYYGPRIGLCFSSFVGPNPQTTNFPLGAIVGVYGELKLSDRFSLQQDLLYTSAGSNYSLSSRPDNEYKVSITYMTFPMHADLRLTNTIHFQAGFQGALMISALTNTTNMGNTMKEDNLNGYNRFDYGPSAGICYQFTKGLNISLRIYRGLRPVYKDTTGEELYNTYLQCMVGYRFGK